MRRIQRNPTMQTNKDELQEIMSLEIELYTKKYGKDFKAALLKILALEKMLNPVEKKEEKPRLIPLVKWNDYHPDPSVKALRMLVFRQHENGFDKVIVKRGSRILIDEQEYFKWNQSRAV